LTDAAGGRIAQVESAQTAPAAKKTTAKVPRNSAVSFWVRLYIESASKAEPVVQRKAEKPNRREV
jgi:hypothetical protein